jgi:uncharacterized membrane protein
MNFFKGKKIDFRSHPALRNPNDVHAASLSMTERFCQKVGAATGAPMTLVAVIIFQLVWIVVGHVTKMDPFPFVFMLTVSNVIQLILIVVLAVAGKQQAAHDQIRAEEDHAALSRVLYHAEAQEQLLLKMAERAGVDTADIQKIMVDLASSSNTPSVPAAPTPAAG